jgi:hypothetical protein
LRTAGMAAVEWWPEEPRMLFVSAGTASPRVVAMAAVAATATAPHAARPGTLPVTAAVAIRAARPIPACSIGTD